MAGRTALVTGASRGIGLEIARALHDAGCAVCITGRDADALAAARADLGEDGVLAVAGNSGDGAHRADAVERTVAAFGSLDVVVNNAGINPVYGPLLDAGLDAVLKIFDTNVVAALGWVQLAHGAWMGAHGGTVVNVASVAGLRPASNIGAYGASKAALVSLTRQLALELGPTIRVNAVAPAVVRTTFARALFAHDEEGVAAGYPLARLGDPVDVAKAVLFLASSESGWVTGETLVVDGGLMQTGGV